MPATEEQLRVQLKAFNERLDRRTENALGLRTYDEGNTPIPPAVVRGKLTRAYTALMSASAAPWGSLIVDSVIDRLEISSIEDTQNKAAAEKAWELWQDNSMDDESKLAHRSALIDGRAYALVWNDPETGEPSVSLDDCTQMVVQFREGSRRHRVAAMRRWVDLNETTFATIYHPDQIYKFQKRKGQQTQWEPREDFTLRNPLDRVPVVELGANRKLRPGPFPYARGDFEHCTGVMDRINLLTFFGLVVALWLGFPLRGVIGDEILTDDDNNQIAPFNSKADEVFQLENPEAKLAEYAAADRKNLSLFEEFEQLASISKTPKHYFPLGGGISNIAEPTIRAFEGTLHARIDGHKSGFGESWEEVNRLLCLNASPDLKLSNRAQMQWKDHESRSLGERADAFVKLTANAAMPPLMAAELALNLDADQIARWQTTQMGSVLDELLRAEVSTPTQGSTPAERSPVPA